MALHPKELVIRFLNPSMLPAKNSKVAFKVELVPCSLFCSVCWEGNFWNLSSFYTKVSKRSDQGNSPYHGKLAFYLGSFPTGIFSYGIFCFYSLALTQFVLNSWGSLCGFIILFLLVSYVPTSSLHHFLSILHKVSSLLRLVLLLHQTSPIF